MDNNITTFLLINTPLFLQRFSLSYFREECCIEYFINRRSSSETISSSLILSYNPLLKDLHISRFYPELYHQTNSKYMSAICFYLLIHHCNKVFVLDESCCISLNTLQNIGDSFYKKLRDFNFHEKKRGMGNVVELNSDIILLPIDTSMITEHVYQTGEIPFMK